MVAQCSICLSTFRHPVCLPCGHIYCKKCLNEHVNVPANQGLTSTCPECRSTFNLVVPDLTYLPEKYHPFISHAVRRVYLDTSSYTELQKQLKQAEARLARKSLSEEELIRRCEALNAALDAHRTGESEANERIQELEEEFEQTESELREDMEQLSTQCEVLRLQNVNGQKENKHLRSRQKMMEARLAETEERNRELEEQLREHQNQSERTLVAYSYMLQSDEDELRERSSEMQRLARAIKPLPRRRIVRARNESPPLVFEERPKRPRLSMPSY